MTDSDPEKRPVIEDVIARFSRIRNSLTGFKLRSHITSRKDASPVIAFRYVGQMIRTIEYILCQTPAKLSQSPSTWIVGSAVIRFTIATRFA
jgi:hypothetical protein